MSQKKAKREELRRAANVADEVKAREASEYGRSFLERLAKAEPLKPVPPRP